MGPGGFDMQQIFAAAQQALSAQQELANSELTGTAGGGAVRAVVSGVGQLLEWSRPVGCLHRHVGRNRAKFADGFGSKTHHHDLLVLSTGHRRRQRE